jgi:hypothetical protein
MPTKAFLLDQAAKCRRHARDILDAEAARGLLTLAAEYEARAAALPGHDAEPPMKHPASD